MQLQLGRRRTWTDGARGVRVADGFAQKVQFWAALGSQRSSPLVRVDRVTGSSYVETLRRHLMPLTRRRPHIFFQQVRVTPNALRDPILPDHCASLRPRSWRSCHVSGLSAQDNAPAHKSNKASAFLRAKLPGRVVLWPPRSPDLSPIENAWAELKRRVNQRSPKDIGQMERMAVAEWAKLASDKKFLAALYGSMERRLRLVVASNGDFVAY